MSNSATILYRRQKKRDRFEKPFPQGLANGEDRIRTPFGPDAEGEPLFCEPSLTTLGVLEWMTDGGEGITWSALRGFPSNGDDHRRSLAVDEWKKYSH